MPMTEYSIGMVHNDAWTIYYGNSELVINYIVENITDGYIKSFKTEESMLCQLNYLNNELTNPTIYKIEDII